MIDTNKYAPLGETIDRANKRAEDVTWDAKVGSVKSVILSGGNFGATTGDEVVISKDGDTWHTGDGDGSSS